MSTDLPPVLTAVRLATNGTHKSVEQLTPFFRPDFDRPAYLRWLHLMHGFYRRVDALVVQAGFTSLTGWHYVPRCELIMNDLAVLGDTPPSEAADPGGVLDPMQVLKSVGELAGLLYVVEGSALGGKVLLKVLERSVGVRATSGASFFAPHGEMPQVHWGDYVQLLARLSGDKVTENEIVKGAVTTFKAFQAWIEQGRRIC